MKKKTFLVSALSAFLLVLSACNGAVIDSSSSGSKSDSSASSSQPTTSSGGGGGGGSSSIAPSSSDEPSSSSQEESSSEEQPSSSQEESSSEEQHSSSQEESSSSESGSSSSEIVTQYTITFSSNGGTGTMEAVTKDEGSKYALPECGFTKEGYDFDYWTIDNESDHRAPGYEFTVNGDVTVTANWKEATPAFVPCLYVSEDNWATKTKVELEQGESAGVYFKTLTLKEGSSFFAQASEEEYYHWGELSAVGNYSQICFAEATGDSHNIDVKKTSEYVIALYTESALGAGLIASSSYDNEDYVLFGVENSGNKSLSYDADLGAFTGEITGKAGSQAAVKIGEEVYTCEENKMYLHNKEGQLNNLKYENDKYTLINDVEKAQVEVYLGENGAISVFLENQTETKYYLVGKINGQEKWTATDYEFKANTEAEGEYLLNDYISLKKDDGVKAMNIKGYAYYPAGNEKELKINEDGEYMIYFRPDGQGGEGWHEGYLYIEKKAEPVQQATSIKVNGGDPIVLDSNGSALVTAPANAIITGLVDTTPVALTAKTDEGNNVVAGENAGEIKVVKEVTNARIWVDGKNNVWLNDYTEDTSVYLLYKNGDSEHPFTLNLNGATHEAAIKATRGDYFTVTKDGNPYTITAENYDGNNVKVINEKLTVLTGADQDLTFYLHSDEDHTVWLTGYVANEYFLTIGTNAAVQLTQSEEQGKEYEYIYEKLDVKAGDAISVMHDQQSYTITRKAGDDNNISTLALTIHNDADNANIYLDVVNEAHPIWITGYQDIPVVYTYYIEKIHGESVSDKIQLTQSTPAEISSSGANDQYEYTFEHGVVGGDYIRFFYSTDAGSTYTQFANAIAIEEGQNLNVTGEIGKYVVIASTGGVTTTLYLKIKDSSYSLRLGGYALTYYLTVDGTQVDLAKDGNQYKAEGVSVKANDQIVVYKDRVVDNTIAADLSIGNNLNADLQVVAAGTVDIYVKPTSSNIWVTGYAYAHVGEQSYELFWHDGEGDDDYYTANIPSAAKDAAITIDIGGTAKTAQVADQNPNNVRIKDEALKVTTAFNSQQVMKVYPNGNNAYVYLGGYVASYAIIVTRSEAPSSPIALVWSEQDNAYKATYNFQVGDVLSATKDGDAITMTNTAGDGNNVGANLTITVAGDNVPMYFHVTAGNPDTYDIYVYTPLYVATVNGVNYTMSVNGDYYEAQIDSVSKGQSVALSFNGGAIEGIGLEERTQQTNNIIDNSGYKVFKDGENVIISIHKETKKVWMTGYYPEFAVNGTALVAKYESTTLKEYGATLEGLTDGAELTFTLDGNAYGATREDNTYNNVKLEDEKLKVIIGGNLYVALKPNGQIWVTGYAQVTVGSTTYFLDRDYEKNEYKAIVTSAALDDLVTARINGVDYSPLTASTGDNNVQVVESVLKVRQAVENMSIYVHDDKSVWLDGYVAPAVKSYALVGTMNSWKVTDTTYSLLPSGENQVSISDVQLAPGDKFKICADGAWDGCLSYGNLSGTTKGLTIDTVAVFADDVASEHNIIMNYTSTRYFNITLNYEDNSINITLVEVTISKKPSESGEVTTDKIYKGSDYTLPSNPYEVPDHQEFDGWMVNSVKRAAGNVMEGVLDDTTIVAQWATLYDVTFNKNGGTGSMSTVTMRAGKYTLPSNGFTAPDGKQFKCWSVGGVEKAVGAQIDVEGTTEVLAVWEDIPAVTYKVTYKVNGGTGKDVIEDGAGTYTLIEKPNTFVAPTNMKFKCWSVGGVEKLPGLTIDVEADTEVLAVWELAYSGLLNGTTPIVFTDASTEPKGEDTWVYQFSATISPESGDTIVIKNDGVAIEGITATGDGNNAYVDDGLKVLYGGSDLTLYFKVYESSYAIWLTGYTKEYNLSINHITTGANSNVFVYSWGDNPSRSLTSFLKGGKVQILSGSSKYTVGIADPNNFNWENVTGKVENNLVSDITSGIYYYFNDNGYTVSTQLVDVLFKVDMTGKTFEDVYVSGSFNDWSTSANKLTYNDKDKVYETTIQLPVGYWPTFKFTINNSWDDAESANRYFEVTGAMTVEYAYNVYPTKNVSVTVTGATFDLDNDSCKAMVHAWGGSEGAHWIQAEIAEDHRTVTFECKDDITHFIVLRVSEEVYNSGTGQWTKSAGAYNKTSGDTAFDKNKTTAYELTWVECPNS